MPISIIHQFYFVHTSAFLTEVQNASGGQALANAINAIFGVGGGGLMTIGQMTEILVLALIPLVAEKVGRKTLLMVGIIAYAARMALFAYMPTIAGVGIPEIVIAIFGVSLHGLCFGCFIFVAFMVVDEETTPDVRASAQNLFNLVIIGIGIIVGSWFATSIVASWATEPVLTAAGQPELNPDGTAVTATNFTKLFSIPLYISLACLLALLVFYPAKSRYERSGTEPQSPDD